MSITLYIQPDIEAFLSVAPAGIVLLFHANCHKKTGPHHGPVGTDNMSLLRGRPE